MKQKIKNQGVENKKPIEPTLRNMQLYEKESFPIRRMKGVRTSASYLKAAFGICFKTKQYTDQRIIEVTRIA
jgi:hypothetical protein